MFQFLGQTKPDTVRLRLFGHFGQGPQHHIELSDVLNELSFRTRRVTAVKSDNVGIEKAHALDAHDTHIAARKPHGDLMVAIQLLFKVLDIKDQPLIGPFGGAFLGHRLALGPCGQCGGIRLGRAGVRMDFPQAGQGSCLKGFSRCFDIVSHGVTLAAPVGKEKSQLDVFVVIWPLGHMGGETNLTQLIRSMEPVLLDGVYVFARVPSLADAAALNPRMMFQEKEAVTVILPRGAAQAVGLAFEFPSRMITLNIHSSLDAVGFLAAITTRLAALQMGVNPVSAFYHDHLFVPEDRAEDALQALVDMTAD